MASVGAHTHANACKVQVNWNLTPITPPITPTPITPTPITPLSLTQLAAD